MASTDARPIPRKNVAYRVTFPILDADGDLVTGASSLDSEVSIDGGTFSDCTNEATEIATSSGMYYLDLTAGEMNGDTIAIIVKTASAGAKTTPIVLYPEEVGDIRVDVVQLSGDTTAADNAEAFFDGTGYAGTNNVIPTVTTVSALAANSVSASALATDAANEIADAVLDRADAVETGLTLRQAQRLIAASTAGKLSGAATTTITIRNAQADSKNRIIATVDADGNRTAITTDLT